MDPIDFIYEVSLVDLRVFEYALEIARQRSFTKAAAHLHITQPTISQQIAKLEEELGVRLFYRDARGISPTPEGVLFLKRAKQILALKEDLKRELFERVVGMGETLTIGATPITVRHLLPSLLEQFQSRYPNVQIHLMEESPEVLHHLTAQGSVDLSILALPVEDPRIATRPMFTEPIYVVLPQVRKPWMPDRLAFFVEKQIPQISLTELSDCPFILLKKEYRFRQSILELCAKAGFQPRIAYETNNIETAQAFAAHGLGVALIPESFKRSAAVDKKQPLYMEIEGHPTRTVVFGYRKDRYLGLAARALMDIYYETYQKTGRHPMGLSS